MWGVVVAYRGDGCKLGGLERELDRPEEGVFRLYVDEGVLECMDDGVLRWPEDGVLLEWV